MKVKILIVLTSLISFGINAQSYHESTSSFIYNGKQVVKPVVSVNYWNEISFRLGGGVLIPKKRLKDFLGVMPMVDLSVNFPLKKEKALDFTVQFAVPEQKEAFVYTRQLDTISSKATFMLNLMIKFKKSIFRAKRQNLNFGLGLGCSSIQTDARNPNYNGEEDENKYENISTLLLSPGFEYVFKTKKEEEFTLAFGLQYSPYKVEGSLKENIGSVFFVPKLLYKF